MTMIKKIADVIGSTVSTWDGDPLSNHLTKEELRDCVRATLAVMLEPTEAMISLTYQTWDDEDWSTPSEILHGVWQAMIKAAMEEANYGKIP